jgi:hypothetical protein
MSVHLPTTPKELAAMSICNWSGERAKWDKQVYDFEVLPVAGQNEVIHYKMAAPPFAPRDFLVMTVFARHVEGTGVMFYMRVADDSLCPVSAEPRGRNYINSVEFAEDPAGGTRMTVLSCLDCSMPMPNWVIGQFIPSEMKKWTEKLERHCASLLKSGVVPSQVPCAAAFRAQETAESALLARRGEFEVLSHGQIQAAACADMTTRGPSCWGCFGGLIKFRGSRKRRETTPRQLPPLSEDPKPSSTNDLPRETQAENLTLLENLMALQVKGKGFNCPPRNSVKVAIMVVAMFMVCKLVLTAVKG